MYKKFFSTIACVVISTTIFAVNVPISIFPIADYSQNINAWLPPGAKNDNERILSAKVQSLRLHDFYDHVFSSGKLSASPWNADYVRRILQASPGLGTTEHKVIYSFDNATRAPSYINYGENFRESSKYWLQEIAANINMKQLNNETYNFSNRAIAINNIHGRILPTNTPSFFKFTIPGQGYPFDNIQVSSIWAGTPLYILSRSNDRAWDLVLTPSLIAWVPSTEVAFVSKNFIYHWQRAAKKHLSAIIVTNTPIISHEQFRFNAYIGSVFPAIVARDNKIKYILVPVKAKSGYASYQYALVTKYNVALMPLPATRHMFATVMKTLLNRPYGWGGMYFYNDCSEELKSLFTPFGIWLPRHSSNQIRAGKEVNLNANDMHERLQYLLDYGSPLMTIIYIGGHIILYVGKFPDAKTKGSVAMTYQNVWGLHPADNSSRSVIGMSVLLPMLEQYPEDNKLQSLAAKKYFELSYLNQWVPQMSLVRDKINLRNLMSAER